MNKALICIKPPGLGDANILLSNIHHISQGINKPLTILAQKTTGARAIFKHDPHVNDVVDLGKRDIFKFIFNIIIFFSFFNRFIIPVNF